ncbi:hypothetical protein [Gordonia sp. (in: high G+C Gram-positive bacteria)]|uniref:hypothetical protein n=1 Tax=Gordonia sp. (in: high G+C Gram-positive bacteria) TaxID=84139 RepID=UPI00261F2233|nr:hypothetical protein [Gordonia sp. (in: high G+C Gram-positive bacteria)]
MSARRIVTVVIGLLTVAAVVCTVFFGVQYGRARAEENARNSALTAAREYVQKMYAWTPQNISDHINFMMGVLIGPAKKDYESHVVGNRIAEQVKQQQVVAQVTDQGSGVVENTRNTATVLLFINQSASRAANEEVQTNPARVVYTMERRGGRWLINDAQLITDQTLEDLVDKQGGTTPPSGAISVPAPSPGAPSSGAPAPSEVTPAPSSEPVPAG